MVGEQTVSTSVWTDQKLQAWTGHARYLWIYLLTCPELGITGLMEWQPQYVAERTGLTKPQLNEALLELQRAKVVDCDGTWLLIVKRWQHTGALVRNVQGLARVELKRAASSAMVQQFLAESGFNDLAIKGNPNLALVPQDPAMQALIGGIEMWPLLAEDADLQARWFELCCRWRTRFPLLNIHDEIQKAHDWLQDTRKRYKNKTRFIDNWLRRAAKESDTPVSNNRYEELKRKFEQAAN